MTYSLGLDAAFRIRSYKIHRMLKEARVSTPDAQSSLKQRSLKEEWCVPYNDCLFPMPLWPPADRDIPCRSGHSLQVLLSQKGDPLLQYTLQDKHVTSPPVTMALSAPIISDYSYQFVSTELLLRDKHN